jgi:vacuolar-type H+-ATPase subunit H
MALEAIKKIKEAETASEERRREINSNIKKILSDADIAARDRSEAIEKEALEKAAVIKKNAAKNAADIMNKILSEHKLACDKMKSEVSANLNKVVESVVERIVNSWQ